MQRCTCARGATRESRVPKSAELAGRGRRPGGERPVALRSRGEEPRRRGRCHEPDGNRWRRRRQWRRAGQMPGNARRTVRLVVNVVAPLARLLDMRAQPGRRAGLGKWDDRRDEELDQTEQRERHDRRPRSRAVRPGRSVCSVCGRIHWIGTTTYGPNTAGTSEVLGFWCRTRPPNGRRR